MTTQIITNNQERELKCWHDLPLSTRPDFDYIDEEERSSPRLVRYRGNWYDVNEFERIPDNVQFGNTRKWDGWQPDSYFSATLLRWGEDYETVIMGLYLS